MFKTFGFPLQVACNDVYQMSKKVRHAHTMVIYIMGGFGGMWEVFFNP